MRSATAIGGSKASVLVDGSAQASTTHRAVATVLGSLGHGGF